MQRAPKIQLYLLAAPSPSRVFPVPKVIPNSSVSVTGMASFSTTLGDIKLCVAPESIISITLFPPIFPSNFMVLGYQSPQLSSRRFPPVYTRHLRIPLLPTRFAPVNLQITENQHTQFFFLAYMPQSPVFITSITEPLGFSILKLSIG